MKVVQFVGKYNSSNFGSCNGEHVHRACSFFSLSPRKSSSVFISLSFRSTFDDRTDFRREFRL